ncbi:Fic family protein, partial [Nocardia xishanensis]|uniref:Fic family protein n=1 Tax=Nocardia xishanensis TaxID=238964 RepID=UPI0012F49009
LAATRPTSTPALPFAPESAASGRDEGASTPTRPDPSADGGGRKPPQGPPAPPTPDPEEPGRGPDVEIARRVTQRLAAENAAAVRELDAADVARNAAMEGLPVTHDELGPYPEQVANTVDRLHRAHPDQAARIEELREAALRYLAAESEVAVLDEALARAMQREALAEEGAGRIDDTIGIVAGEPPRIVVVGWQPPGNVRAQLEAEQPVLRPLLARPEVVVTHIEITTLDDGRITHRRIDFASEGPAAPTPDQRDPGERQSPRQRAEERYQRALRDAHRQIGHPPQGDPRTQVWPGGGHSQQGSSDPVAESDDSTVDLARPEDPRTTVWPGGRQPEQAPPPGPVAESGSKHLGLPADESQPQEQDYDARHRASQSDSVESEGAQPRTADPASGHAEPSQGHVAAPVGEIEAIIAERLAALGIDSEAGRLLEAGLLIEERYLAIAVIAGQPRPEVVFGEQAWAGQLGARLIARQHGNRDLTVDFMVELHDRLTMSTRSEGIDESGEPLPRVGVLSEELTPEQFDAIAENPSLTYLPPPAGPGDFGVIVYPDFTSQDDVRRALQELCDWYNAAKSAPDHDPFAIAAELQRRFVSLHPFEFNGRASRILMNWSLEQDGQYPSAIRDFDADILTPLSDWVEAVRAGSIRYSEWVSRLAEHGSTIDGVALFGLEREQSRYEQIGGETAPFVPGQRHDRARFAQLLQAVTSSDPMVDDADDMLAPPDAVSGTDAELAAWAATFDDPQLRYLIAERSEIAADLVAEFHRGEAPTAAQIIGTARELNAYVREALDRLPTAPGSPDPIPGDVEGMLRMVEALADRRSDVHDLHVALTTLHELTRIVPGNAAVTSQRGTSVDGAESEGTRTRTPDAGEGSGRHRGEPADESVPREQDYEARHRASQSDVAGSDDAQSRVGPGEGAGRHRGEPADESVSREQTYEARHRASQSDVAGSDGAQPGTPDAGEGSGRHRGEPADESQPQDQDYEPRHRVSQSDSVESDGAQPGTPDVDEGSRRHRGEPADESGAQPDYQERHRRDPAEASQQQVEGGHAKLGVPTPESQQPGEQPKAEESGEQPQGEQSGEQPVAGLPGGQPQTAHSGEQPQARQGAQSQAEQPGEQSQLPQQAAQSPVGEPAADPLPPEVREALDRLRAERAEAVARRAEWDDIRRVRAEALDASDASTVDALARAAQQFDDADAAVVELDAEIAELELANTPEGVYRQLMRERAVLAREREFWRAKRDDRYSRFSDLPLPFGDAARALNQSNLARTLEHLEASVARTRSIAGTGEEAGYVASEQLDPGEIARRREQIFKLHDAALRYNRVQAALAEVDRRIAALGRVGVGEPQALSQQVRAEVDRLAGERAREVLDSKPWRQMRADIAARLRVNESDLGPDAAALDRALAEVAGRTVRVDELAERVRNIDLLRDAATRVNEADHRIAHIQGRIAELAGAGRDFLAAEGARQVTERVGFVDGDPQRIIVIAPRGTLDAPRADHDAALLDAIQRDSRVARAMLSRETTIEYRELVAELDQPVTTRRLRSPSREYMTLGPEDAPVLRRVRWQSGEPDSGTWHEVNPQRPGWTTNRKGPTTPKEFKERDLPEGVSGWATNPFQAAVVDPFVDNGPGVNKSLLPTIPGGDPIYPGQTYELPFADVFYHFMRLTLEPAKLFGFSWYSDSAHPGRISPGFKGHPWFRKKGADVQPMAREPERAEREHAPGELEGYERKQDDQQRAWKRVQDWATEQYRMFRTSDGDVDRIAANLAARPEFEGAAREVRAAEIVDRIASIVEDYMSARIEVTTRTPDDPGPDLSAVVADLTGTLRSEQPGDAARLVDDIREALLGLKPDRAAISAEVAVRLDNSVKAFTREQIAQIKHHYMEAVYRRALPIDGSPARVRLDEVADVAEAWLRLIGDEARPEDVLMLQDALAESNFLLANDYVSWRDANQYAIRIGFDWDSVRPPLTDWRKGIRYAPAPLPADAPLPPRPDTDDDGPDPLPPGPGSGPNSPPSLPPGRSPGQLPPAPSPDDVATVPLGRPIGADDPTVRLPGPDGSEDPTVELPSPFGVDDSTVSLSGAVGSEDSTVELPGRFGVDDSTVSLSGAVGSEDPTVELPSPFDAEEPTVPLPSPESAEEPTIPLPSSTGAHDPTVHLPGLGGIDTPTIDLRHPGQASGEPSAPGPQDPADPRESTADESANTQRTQQIPSQDGGSDTPTIDLGRLGPQAGEPAPGRQAPGDPRESNWRAGTDTERTQPIRSQEAAPDDPNSGPSDDGGVPPGDGPNQDPTASIGDNPTIDLRRGADSVERDADGRPVEPQGGARAEQSDTTRPVRPDQADNPEQGGWTETSADRYEIDNPQFGARLRYGFENWDAVVDGLTPHERAVLERITSLTADGSTFRAAIDAALRGEAELTPELAEAVDILDDVLTRLRLPETAVMTYVRPENPLDMSSDVIGSLHQIAEFPQLALGETPPIDGGRFHLELTVPAGTPALFMNRFLPSGMPVPVMMLGRGLNWRVDSVRSLGNDGHWLIRATVVPAVHQPDSQPVNEFTRSESAERPPSGKSLRQRIRERFGRTRAEGDAAVSPAEPDAGGDGKKPPQAPPLTAAEPNDSRDEGDSAAQPPQLSPPEPVAEDPGVPPLRLTPPDQDPEPYAEPSPRAIQRPDAPPKDEWSRRDIPEIVRVLSERHGVDLLGERRALRVLRFDLNHLDPEVLREYARAIDDMLRKYPGAPVAILDVLAVHHHRSAFAATQWEPENGGARVILDYQLATSAELFWAAMSMDVAGGFKHPSVERRPVYGAVVHEFGHVLDFLSSEETRATIEDILRRRYEEEFAAAHLAAGGEGYHTWIRQLSGYSFHDNGEFNPGEAIPEGFAEVELDGDAASEPARVIHETLVANARRALAEGTIPQPPSQLAPGPDAGGGGQKPPHQPPVGMPEPGGPNGDGSEPSAQQPDSNTDSDSTSQQGAEPSRSEIVVAARDDLAAEPSGDDAESAASIPDSDAGQPAQEPQRSLTRGEHDQLDRLLAERAVAVSRREQWRDIRRMRAQHLPVNVDVDLTRDALVSTMDELRGKTMRVDEMQARLAAIDALEQAAEHFNDAEHDIARLDDEIAALRDGTSQDEYEALVRERAAAVAEREFWRAKRNDRASRFSDILPTLRGADDSLGTDLAPTLEHLRDALIGQRTILGVGEDLPTETPELVGEAELSHRRQQVFKLQRAAEEYERAAARVAEIDRRLGELGRSSAEVEPTLSHEARTEIDRLARERARQVLAVEPWRGMREDLARRLRVNENELGHGQLDETLAEVAGRTIEASRVSEQARNLNLLREAAERVNAAENAIDRLQARIAELAGAGRAFLDEAGARPIVPRVGLVEGDQPRIIVVAPRGGFDNPRADHDAALARAVRENASVAHAMTRHETTVEFHEIIADRGEPVRYRRMGGPRREFLEITGSRPLDPGVLLVRWFDAAGRPHEVRPDRPSWRTNRDGGTVPKTFHPRDLPEGVSGWAVNPFQAALEDPFTDDGPGVNKDLLPAIPGGDPLETGPTYEVPFSGLFYHTMRLILETAKLSGFTWYGDKSHPGRIRPGFKGHPWFRKKSADVQPMAREWNVRDRFALPENERWYRASQTAEQRAWERVQRRAELEYERFRGDDSDIDRIADQLARNPAAEGAARAVRAAELVALVDGLIEDHIEGLPTTRSPGRPGPDLTAAIDEITGHLRNEKPGDAEQLVNYIYEELTRGTEVDRKELAGEVAGRLDDSAHAFTRAEIAQIKHHLMNAEYLRTDWRTGVVVRQRLDAVVDVALAWQRLIDGEPNDADILMLQDALAESNFLSRNPTAFWNLANEHAVRIGFDWNSHRPPFTDWAQGAKYAPPPREREYSPYVLPPRPPATESNTAALPPAEPPSPDEQSSEDSGPVDPRTVYWPGGPVTESDANQGIGASRPESGSSSGDQPVDPRTVHWPGGVSESESGVGRSRPEGGGLSGDEPVDPRTVHWPGGTVAESGADGGVGELLSDGGSSSGDQPVDPRTVHWPGGVSESESVVGQSRPEGGGLSGDEPVDPRTVHWPGGAPESTTGGDDQLPGQSTSPEPLASGRQRGQTAEQSDPVDPRTEYWPGGRPESETNADDQPPRRDEGDDSGAAGAPSRPDPVPDSDPAGAARSLPNASEQPEPVAETPTYSDPSGSDPGDTSKPVPGQRSESSAETSRPNTGTSLSRPTTEGPTRPATDADSETDENRSQPDEAGAESERGAAEGTVRPDTAGGQSLTETGDDSPDAGVSSPPVAERTARLEGEDGRRAPEGGARSADGERTARTEGGLSRPEGSAERSGPEAGTPSEDGVQSENDRGEGERAARPEAEGDAGQSRPEGRTQSEGPARSEDGGRAPEGGVQSADGERTALTEGGLSRPEGSAGRSRPGVGMPPEGGAQSEGGVSPDSGRRPDSDGGRRERTASPEGEADLSTTEGGERQSRTDGGSRPDGGVRSDTGGRPEGDEGRRRAEGERRPDDGSTRRRPDGGAAAGLWAGSGAEDDREPRMTPPVTPFPQVPPMPQPPRPPVPPVPPVP